ncbi:sigma-70 family RNA polymerase sigma factor [Peredibacter starrii]|uniref:Sigma-70 family RNA polymerase sigma factor n=1 Tax=Peredibacter starrii TaxID=28202 RepID=A0AAX4HTP1_9BACT|nr:sigma-70 family RNA polymerase sigma factor [Peredibacter starrii]WPU66647.1 sigma-70 family RNA polymerase sigma factor [Peredibacter starrii]
MAHTNNYLKEWEGLFIQYRPYLISFAFRMTGSLSESEDIVQDTFIQCASINPKELNNPKSWLTKITSNKSLDYMKVAYKKREIYHGTWLPDAVPDSFQYWGNLIDGVAPDKKLLYTESLSTSFLLLLQKLSPEERMIYILNEVFDYSFSEIAEFMNKSEDACKKSAQRARKALENEKRYRSYTKEDESVVSKFFDLANRGDKEGLMAMLSSDSEFWSDGGGKVSVASKVVVYDPQFISKFISAVWSAPIFKNENIRQELKIVNEKPGLVISRRHEDGVWRFETIMTMEVENGKIARIFTQRNPDKLQALLKS